MKQAGHLNQQGETFILQKILLPRCGCGTGATHEIRSPLGRLIGYYCQECAQRLMPILQAELFTGTSTPRRGAPNAPTF